MGSEEVAETANPPDMMILLPLREELVVADLQRFLATLEFVGATGGERIVESDHGWMRTLGAAVRGKADE